MKKRKRRFKGKERREKEGERERKEGEKGKKGAKEKGGRKEKKGWKEKKGGKEEGKKSFTVCQLGFGQLEFLFEVMKAQMLYMNHDANRNINYDTSTQYLT